MDQPFRKQIREGNGTWKGEFGISLFKGDVQIVVTDLPPLPYYHFYAQILRKKRKQAFDQEKKRKKTRFRPRRKKK